MIVVASRPALGQVDSFESYPLGVVSEARSGPFGTWTSGQHAEVSNRRASTGTQALRIFGGTSRSVELQLDAPRDGAVVRFRAERWTARAPFAFAVLVRRGNAWESVFADDGQQIVIGDYHAAIAIDVDGAFDALRFVCTAPDGGGVLLDDLAIEPRQSMRIVAVTTEQPVLPMLVGSRGNPVARIRITVAGTMSPLVLTRTRWTLRSGRGLAGVSSASVHALNAERLPWRRPDEVFGDETRFGEPAAAAGSLDVSGELTLQPGDNVLWLAVSLVGTGTGTGAGDVDVDGWIDAGCQELEFADGRVMQPSVQEPDGVQRMGVAVRRAVAGDSGVSRIPGIVTTKHGTLLAVYDVRHRGWTDLPGDIDVALRRSTDGGRTWSPSATILDMGDDPAWRFDGVGDPSMLHDAVTGTVWVAATWSHGDRSWHGSGPGLTPEETGQVVLTRSTDDGRTWSPPINVTAQVKRPEWAFVLPSPGRGITMADGTLVFPAQFRSSPENDRIPFATIMFSRDRGNTWQIGRGARADTTESRVVEVEPGVLMLNMRDNRGGWRAVAVTRDLGTTWEEHATNRRALPEPVCNAGLLRAGPVDERGRPWLVFVNPAVASGPRRDMTLKLSRDGGLHWPGSDHVLIDSGESAGYASLTMVDQETVGVLYESSRAHLVFQRVPLSRFTGQSTP
ncbi:MAG: exo-alpha-sialidase [Phycisphaerales bacterium]